VYDGAHAFGVEIDGQGIGTFGDVCMFSFHATKLYHTAEGGALTYRDPNLKPRVDLLKNFGIENEETVLMPGINGKMNEIQAALGLVLLKYLDEERAKRKALFDTYRACLQNIDGISLATVAPRGVTPSYQYLVLRINEEQFGCSRDQVYGRFKQYNVMTRKYFYPLCSEYACYRQLPSARRSGLLTAHRVAAEVLVMPFYGALTAADVELICAILKGFRGTGER
jgi:dTDP-4-amino-4,6-dideoxygalactose transaminase